MSLRGLFAVVAVAISCAGCGGKTSLFSGAKGPNQSNLPAYGVTPSGRNSGDSEPSGTGSAGIGFPLIATKNTTRVAGASPAEEAAQVAVAVFPSAAPGTHPTGVALAPTDDWQAAIASASLMGSPFRAPILLSGPGKLPAATALALKLLAPTGERSLGGAQLIRIGDVPSAAGLHDATIGGGDPYAVAASIDRFEARARGGESLNVVVASGDHPAYAMPAAGWAAESGEPVLFVTSSSVPKATAQALEAHHHPRIYVLGPPSVISDSVLAQLRRYGTVKRVGGTDPASNSVAFAAYRDPPCPSGQPCAHIPHSFGWAIRSPGHAYVLMDDSDPLVAAAAAPLSSSGGYGPQLLLDNPNTLPRPVLNYFLDYATPGYTQEGPTAAVYNHGWLIGDVRSISAAVQAQVDSLLEVVPQR